MNSYPHILLVEDDTGLRETIEELLKLNDYQVSTASNGVEGLESIRNTVPDVIISDLMMPVMDGFAFLKEVRILKETALTPFVFLTAKALIETKIKGLEFGADDYVTKPFEIQELLLKVNRLVSTRERLKQKYLSEPEAIEAISKDEQFILDLKLVLEDNLTDASLSMSDIATQMNVSTSTLQKKIKKVLNSSVSQFVREYRLKRARDYIYLNFGTLKEIADRTGFNSLSYFSSSYKDYFGTNPSDDY